MAVLAEQIIQPGADHALVDRLHRKQQLLSAGDPAHAEIKTALIIGGGGMRGAYSAGVVAGLEELGLYELFDDAIGISAGACAVAYLLAANAKVGASIYSEDLTNKQFINPLRPKSIMDINFLETIFRSVKPLDQEAVRHNRTRFHIGLTEVATGKPVYMNVDEHPDLDVISAIITSSSIPGIVRQQDAIDGVLYSDGLTGCTQPLDYAINVLGATDILIVLNRPLHAKEKLPASERLLNSAMLRSYSQDFKTAHMRRFVTSNFRPEATYSDDVNIGVLCPEKDFVKSLSKDSKALANLSEYALAQTVNLLG